MEPYVHFPPLEPGEEVVYQGPDEPPLQHGKTYTVARNLGNNIEGKRDYIALRDVAGEFSETLFDRSRQNA